MDNIYSAILQAQSSGQSAALCTVIKSSGSVPRHSTSKMLVFADGKFVGTVGGGGMEQRTIEEAQAVARSGQSKIVEYNLVDPKQGDPGVCGGTVEIFIEPINPPPSVIIIGAGHVGNATAHLAKWLGFRVIVMDDRVEFVTPEWIPNADVYLPGSVIDLLPQANLNSQTYIVAVTRGYNIDVGILPTLLDYRRGLHRRDRIEAALDAGAERTAREGRARRQTGSRSRADRVGVERGDAGRDRGEHHGRDHHAAQWRHGEVDENDTMSNDKYKSADHCMDFDD